MAKSTNSRKIFTISLSFIFLLLLGFADISTAQARLDIPAANTEIANAVPMSLIKEIALVKSKATWGQGVLGDPVPLSDLNGNVIVYMFPYRIGADTFPPYDEILRGIKEGRELRTLINTSGTEKSKEMYMKMDHVKTAPIKTAVISEPENPGRPPLNPVRPDGSLSKKQEFEEMSRFASRKAMGAEEFGTILVSATYDRFPVPAYFHYLAPYYANFDLALEKAEQTIGKGASLKSIYFMGLEGQYFEFVNNSSSALINSKTFEAKTLKALKQPENPQTQVPTDSTAILPKKAKRDAEISEEWKKLKSEIGGE